CTRIGFGEQLMVNWFDVW
nr:immunoglobulin heavy chain junction region [Macaca mulatta]MOW22724.1 immunoglobulin heavy chain junction region [Macaca mulatta]MOW22781.1 immunoglobulin heavy chain junction region [Macaca mulatta]MOW22990.1 immunoglobulin heavy chain junction region [Macaca mulatta]